MGKGGRLAMALVSAVLILVPAVSPEAPAAGAAPPAGSSLRAQASDTPADEARLLKEVEDSLNRKNSLDAKVAELDGDLREAQTDLRNAENSLFAVLSKERGAQVRLSNVQEQLEAAHVALRAQAVAAYVGRPSGSSLSDLLHTQNLDQLVTKQSYLRVVADTQADLIAARERLQNELNDLLEELAAARAKARNDRDVIASKKNEMQAARDAQAAVRFQVSVEIANRNAALQEIVARKDEFQAQARDLEAQSAAISESLGRRSSSSSGDSSSSRSESRSSSSSGDLADPLTSIRITSNFGWRVHPIYGDSRLHSGVDLSATSGTPIRAAGDGVVVSAGWLGGYGYAVVIDHGGGIATLYGHQSVLAVSQGQQVEKGQTIGRVGCTGSCTGPHLHYEVRINGTPVDPRPYL